MADAMVYNPSPKDDKEKKPKTTHINIILAIVAIIVALGIAGLFIHSLRESEVVERGSTSETISDSNNQSTINGGEDSIDIVSDDVDTQKAPGRTQSEIESNKEKLRNQRRQEVGR